MSSVAHRCTGCGRAFKARVHAKTCSTTCRVRAHRRRHADAEAARDRAFALLLEHSREVLASIGEHREPDRELLDDLGRRMDEAADRAAVLLAPASRS